MHEAMSDWELAHPPGLLGAPLSDLRLVRPGDVVMCGYFCDNLGGGPAGARFLARQLRYYSEPDAALPSIHDLGDLNVFPLEPEKHKNAICKQLDKIAAAGGIPLLVGGDSSGLEILASHIAQRNGRAPVIHTPGLQVPDSNDDAPSVLGLDLSKWPFPGIKGQCASSRFSDLLLCLDSLPEQAAGGAVFGFAPSLDWSGAVETRFVRDCLLNIVGKLTPKVRNHASS